MKTALNRTELNRLKDLAQTDGLNATARRIGIGKATLHRILHGGATPSADTAEKILACLRGDMVTDGPTPAVEVKEAVPNPNPIQNQKAIRQKTDKQISEEIELHAQLVKTGVMEMMNSILLGRLNGEITFTLKGAR